VVGGQNLARCFLYTSIPQIGKTQAVFLFGTAKSKNPTCEGRDVRPV